jgi:alkanesulfonate monooxygenase SsuD/methylene tetrahydromethanopterin reductase-like flavin-dependent oxidoreductase (luciferase family)
MISFGAYLPRAIDPARLVEIARDLEGLGYESLWLTDHLVDPYDKVDSPFPECWTTLTAIACATRRTRIGPLVLCNSFRHPTLVAKMTSTLDAICGGRLNIGLGAGWFEDEYRRYGFDYRPAKERIDALSEAIQIILGMWTEPSFSFSGKYYHCVNAVNEPKPVQKPHPRLLVGGTGKRVLSLAAKYADAYNAGGPGPISSLEEYQGYLSTLRDLCNKHGRDYNSIRRTWGGHIWLSRSESDAKEAIDHWKLEENRSIVGTREECVKQLNAFANAGVQEVIALFPDLWTDGSLETARYFSEEVLPLYLGKSMPG